MQVRTHLKLSCAIATLLALTLAQAATMTQADYSAGKSRISGDYKADKVACGAMAGNAKDICVEEAKAAQTKALADAKLGMQIGAAQHDATADKRDADQAVALAKCDVMAGETKTACVAAAKAKFGKL